MPDATLLVRNYLLQNATLLALCPGSQPTVPGSTDDLAVHIVGGELPEYADPNTYQPFITIATEGGRPHPEAPIATDRVKIRVWAGANEYPLARQIIEEVETWLHRKNMIDLSPDGFIIISQQTVGAQNITDADTGWSTIVEFYDITSRDSINTEGIVPPPDATVGVGAGPVGSGGAGR